MKTRYALLLLPFFFTACDKGGDPHDHSAASAEEIMTIEEPVSVVDGVTVVEMTGNDRMQFNLEAFSVPAGSPVKVVFRNIGKMPKAAMGHNVVFLTADADESAFATAAAAARDNDYLPADMMDQVLATTKLLGPGETDIIEFTAPAESGDYVYLCSFPAHMYAGMRGIMTVE